MTATVVHGRLPKIAIPNHYDLFYNRIDLEARFFEGRVVLDFTATSSAAETAACNSSLVVHAHELQLTGATLEQVEEESETNQKSRKAVEFRYQLHHQTCEIIFEKDGSTGSFWQPGKKYLLTMDFQGCLNDQMAGFYRSSYTNLQGQQAFLATTQFEPTDARRAFPCLDEPALKATFQLRVQIPAQFRAISNTPIVASHTFAANSSLLKTVTFDKTPKMSSYLVALVIGEFDSISCTSPTTKIQTTVWTVPGKATQASFCLDTATRCLDFLQDIYGVPYPLTKSDLIAIPDFASGAMENWGCVTYREAKVLVTSQSSESIRRGIARTVAHELSHMWYGNLVTPEWWTTLWLKEGVARFMEFVALDGLFPTWKVWEEFVQSVFGLALSLDSLQSSHPVEVAVMHSDEINEIFDAISYAKGASVVRMLACYIGMEDFMKGMRLYLTRHAYGNAVSEDFWRALSETSGKPAVEFMKPWTNVTGFPILQLVASDNGKVSMNSTRFNAGGPDTKDSDNTKWPMPVTALVEGTNEIQGPWVIHGPENDDSDIVLKQIQAWTEAGKWFKLNVGQQSFYRVNYTTEQWQRLAATMDPESDSPLSATDRLGLISDSFAAGKAGYASIVDSLRLVKGFSEHEIAEYVVWQELSSNLSSLASLYRSESFYPKLQEYLRNLYTKQAALLGWEASPTESARTGTLRGTVLRIMGVANDSNVLLEAFQRFLVVAKEDSLGTVSGDIRRVLLRLALRHDEETVYQFLKELLEKNETLQPETQRDCLVVMGCVKNPSLHLEMLDYTFFSGKVRQQDIAFPLSTLSGASDEGGRATWGYFKKNFDKLRAKLGSVGWRGCVGLCASGLRTEAEAQEVEAFFKEPGHVAGSGARRLQQAMEVVRTQAVRMERDREALEAFFQE